MDDPVFRSELYSNNLLPGSLKSEIKAIPTTAAKAEHFLDCGINNDSANFQKLVKVMKDSTHDRVQMVAIHITDAVESKTKNGTYVRQCLCS